MKLIYNRLRDDYCEIEINIQVGKVKRKKFWKSRVEKENFIFIHVSSKLIWF